MTTHRGAYIVSANLLHNYSVASVVSSDGVGCAISDNLKKVPMRQSKETWIEDWIQTVEEMVELDLKTESSQ